MTLNVFPGIRAPGFLDSVRGGEQFHKVKHPLVHWLYIGKDLASSGSVRLECVPTGGGAAYVMQGSHLLKIFPNREDSGLLWDIITPGLGRWVLWFLAGLGPRIQ